MLTLKPKIKRSKTLVSLIVSIILHCNASVYEIATLQVTVKIFWSVTENIVKKRYANSVKEDIILDIS